MKNNKEYQFDWQLQQELKQYKRRDKQFRAMRKAKRSVQWEVV